MINVQRVVAALLGLIFPVVLLVALLGLRLEATFLDPEFYPEQMEKRDVYRFVMVDVLESALAEALAIEPGHFGSAMRDNPLRSTGLDAMQISDAVQRALSPEELQRIASPSVLQVGKYISAEQDTLTVQADAGDSIKKVKDELHNLMRESGGYGQLLEKEVNPRIRENSEEALAESENVSGWVFYLLGSGQDASDKLVRVIMSILTPEWLAEQVEQVLDPLTAYLVGESDAFEITVRLSDTQAVTATEQTKAILQEVNAYDLVYTGVVEPAVVDSLGAEVELPYGLAVTSEEVVLALGQSALPELVRQQSEMLVDEVSAYVTGRSDGFTIEISLARNKEAAGAALTELANGKLAQALEALPACATQPEALGAVASLRQQEVPACIPPGAATESILEQVTLSIGDSVQTRVIDPVPDTIRFTESSLRAALAEAGGPQAEEAIDASRRVFQEGFYYNHERLRGDLAQRGNALEALDGTRAFLTDGYTLATPESRKGLLGGELGVVLDTIRAAAERVRGYGWATRAIPVALLVIISLLAGTTWRSKIGWGAFTLLLSAVAVFLVASVAYGAVAGEAFERVRAEIPDSFGGPFGGTAILVADRLVDMVQAVADEFVAGIRLQSIILAAVSLVALLGAIFLKRTSRS